MEVGLMQHIKRNRDWRNTHLARPQNCINGGRSATSEMLNSDKQQCEDYCERVAEIIFDTHIKVKIVQMKISIDKQVWDLPKENLQTSVKNKWSSCEDRLRCDHRYLNWKLKKNKNWVLFFLNASITLHVSKAKQKSLFSVTVPKLWALSDDKCRNLPAHFPSLVPFQVPQPFLDLSSQNISFAYWQIHKDIKLSPKSTVKTEKQTKH